MGSSVSSLLAPICLIDIDTSGLTSALVTYSLIITRQSSRVAMTSSCTYCFRVPVTVATVYRDDVEVAAAKGGENLKLRLTGIDEEEMQPGFVICARHLPVPCVTHFGAQLQVWTLSGAGQVQHA